MPGFKIYEDEAEHGGTQYRLSAEFLWFWVNTLLFYTRRETSRWDDKCRSWGFYFMDRINFVWRWGAFYWSFDLPFVSTVFVKHEILSLDRRRIVHRCSHGLVDMEAQDRAKAANTVQLPYRYRLKNGEVQSAIASVVVERWTRRWKWTPFMAIEDSIWATFSEEIGPGRGSWKGGVTGCGWNMEPEESVVHCLQRMQEQRRFER